MIAHTLAGDVPVQPGGAAQEILHWVADGVALFLGFMATGTNNGTYRLLVNGDPWYTYITNPNNRTAYVADRATRFASGTVISLTVQETSGVVEYFSATLLGGAS